VMAARPSKVYIPFEPLLQKITAWLQFPAPVYGFIDIQESRDRAAHKAVKKLIFLYGVKVSDFTYDQLRLHELCLKLFRNKCAELLQDKGKSPKPVTGESSGHGLGVDNVHVSIDYAQVLVIVVRKTGASVTTIETTWVEGHGFVSWVMISCPRSNSGMECIFSEFCASASVAEQRVSKKAVFYLACKYNLEIVDANYGATAKMSRECYLLREKYLILKAHLHRLEHAPPQAPTTSPVVHEENVSPVDEAAPVPVRSTLPVTPAKRKKLLQVAHEQELEASTSGQAVSGLLELGQLFCGSEST
uniref:Uncharacterized protein n=1 Tax=Chenopodium quinoa TaxID=63459 RepID=A0A803KWQ0_CHEQI